jgi:hypothetical protein
MREIMLKIYEDTKVYVLAPSNGVTGGPEALHQLVDRLNLLGIDAYMVYLGPETNQQIISGEGWLKYLKFTDVPASYQHYTIKVATNIQDNNHNIIITPEIWPNATNFFENIQKVIWWLAVPVGDVNILGDANSMSHFYQSEYAKQALIENGIRYIYPLSDYTNKEFMLKKKCKKEDIVLYNPKKGLDFTKYIYEFDTTLNFIPIQNMNAEEIKELMSRSKVYIDFGHHPGKDRIPREAATSNCCVLVGNRGSANYYRDVPIGVEYVFDTINFNPGNVVAKIRDCLENYSDRVKDFEIYRKQILMEEINFHNEVKAIFSLEEKL